MRTSSTRTLGGRSSISLKVYAAAVVSAVVLLAGMAHLAYDEHLPHAPLPVSVMVGTQSTTPLEVAITSEPLAITSATEGPEDADGAPSLLPIANPQQCRCLVCDHGNMTEFIVASNLNDTVKGRKVSLLVHRGTVTNKKRKQRPIYVFVCERRPLPGYPHTMAPPKQMRLPRLTMSVPTKLGFNVMYRVAEPAKTAMKKHCLPTANVSALFLGDSLTFGFLVQKKFNWPMPYNFDVGTVAAEWNTSRRSLSSYWRVALCTLEKWMPSKSRPAPTEGEYWFKRAFPIGRMGATTTDFVTEYFGKLKEHLNTQVNKAGPVSFVSIFLGINDILKHAENRVNASAEFEQNMRQILTEVRATFKGPMVIGTVPFCTDPGRASSTWFSRKVWYNWAVEEVNKAIHVLAAEYHLAVADYQSALFHWRKNLPMIDGTHPAWWGHRVLAMELLKAIPASLEIMPGRYCASGT